MLRHLARRCAALLMIIPIAACTGVFFQPMTDHVLSPDQLGLTFHDVDFKVEDGQTLHGWYLPGEGEVQGSVLFLHGNAENISTHLASVAWMPEAGFNVFLFDYRGYGRSIGAPDLEGVHLDSQAALEWLLTKEDVDPDRLAVFGQSLGGAIALSAFRDQADEGRFKTLIVEGAFAGYRMIAREKLESSWLTYLFSWPLGFAISDRYQPSNAIASYAPTPVLVIQGEGDRVIPRHHGELLFDAAKKPKQLWLASGIGHIGFLRHQPEQERFAAYLIETFNQP